MGFDSFRVLLELHVQRVRFFYVDLTFFGVVMSVFDVVECYAR